MASLERVCLVMCCTRAGQMLLSIAILVSTVSAQDTDVAPIIELLGENDKEFRALAFEQIRTAAPGEDATKAFAATLGDLPPGTQVELLSALAARKDPAAGPEVRKLLNDTSDAPVRVAAIKALGTLGGAEDLPALVTAMSDTAEEQAAARRSLILLPGDAASQAMVNQLSGATSETQIAIVEILTTRRARTTVPAIMELARSDDASVRAAAMKALGELGEEQHVAGMVQGVLKAERGRERSNAEKMIMLVCHRIEDPQQRADALLAAMDELPDDQREVLFSTLGRVGGPDALEVIEDKLAAGNFDERDTALTALCNWPDASVAFRLLELARTEEDAGHRRRALRALIRVAPLPDDREDGLRLDLMRTAMAMCEVDDDRMLILERAKAVRTVETLRYVLPFTRQDPFIEQACLTVVELAHHSGLREAHRDEFHEALDQVIQISEDATTKDRAQRYKKGETWVRPKS